MDAPECGPNKTCKRGRENLCLAQRLLRVSPTDGILILARLLYRYLRPYRWFLLAVLILEFAAALASLYLPSLNADIVNKGVVTGDTDYIWSTGLLMLLVSFGQIVAALAATVCAAAAAMRLGRDIRNDVFRRVSGFSEREISRFGAGSLITRNTNDVQQVQMLAMMAATMLIMAPMLAIGGIIMALRQELSLAWIIAVSVPVLLLIAGGVVWRMVPLFRIYQVKLDAVNRVMREQLTGVRVVRAYVREQIEATRFRVATTWHWMPKVTCGWDRWPAWPASMASASPCMIVPTRRPCRAT